MPSKDESIGHVSRSVTTMLSQDHLKHRLTQTQRDQFETQGYLRLKGALSEDLVHELTQRVDDIYALHQLGGFDPYTKKVFNNHRPFFYPNFLKDDQRFVNLLDWPVTFPPVWEILGWNIYSYHSHLIVTPPRPADDPGSMGFHRDSGRVNIEESGSPRLSIKVSFWLSDVSSPDRGNLFVVPGSHRFSHLPENPKDVPESVPICCAPGDAVLFDRRLWHSASPNHSEVTRKALFIGYGYRWIRPKDDMTIPQTLLEKNDPVRRQLLGDDTDANGKYSPKEGDVPLRTWLIENELIQRTD